MLQTAQCAAGVLNATSSSDGTFEVALDLAAIEPPPSPGDTITFDAEYIGPTRERIAESVSVAVRFSEFELTLAISTRNDLPLREFAITADVSGPSSPGGVTVTVSSHQPHACTFTDCLL